MARTYLFLGGSNTAADRFWLPASNGLGDGYVSVLYEYLSARGVPAEVINKGQDGFTVPALLRMVSRDLSSWRPDVICVLIGINDVGVAMNTGVSLKEQSFSANYARLIELLRPKAQLLLLGPFLFPQPQEYMGWMDCVREAEESIASLAQQFHIPFLPLQEPMNRAARESGIRAVTKDGVHLTAEGHRILADYIFPHLP